MLSASNTRIHNCFWSSALKSQLVTPLKHGQHNGLIWHCSEVMPCPGTILKEFLSTDQYNEIYPLTCTLMDKDWSYLVVFQVIANHESLINKYLDPRTCWIHLIIGSCLVQNFTVTIYNLSTHIWPGSQL